MQLIKNQSLRFHSWPLYSVCIPLKKVHSHHLLKSGRWSFLSWEILKVHFLRGIKILVQLGNILTKKKTPRPKMYFIKNLSLHNLFERWRKRLLQLESLSLPENGLTLSKCSWNLTQFESNIDKNLRKVMQKSQFAVFDLQIWKTFRCRWNF